MIFEEKRVSLRNDPAFVLAMLYTIGFFGVVFCSVLLVIPEDKAGTVQQLISILSIIQTSIVNYFYGASKSAKEAQKVSDDRKVQLDNTITDIARKASDLPPNASNAPNAPDAPSSGEPISAENVNIEAKGDVNVTKDKP